MQDNGGEVSQKLVCLFPCMQPDDSWEIVAWETNISWGQVRGSCTTTMFVPEKDVPESGVDVAAA